LDCIWLQEYRLSGDIFGNKAQSRGYFFWLPQKYDSPINIFLIHTLPIKAPTQKLFLKNSNYTSTFLGQNLPLLQKKLID
jgi:hypothetical protein